MREAVLGGRADHEWAADPRTREVVEELLAGVTLDRAVVGLSGGERRRCSLAALLLGDARPDRARRADQPPRRRGGRLAGRPPRQPRRPRWSWSPTTGGSSTRSARRRGRCTTASVDAYEGGYAAFVLAKAERQRQAAASEARRQNLVRKELAWLRRGPPARTSKPKFRIDAANALIEDVPPPRDRLELQRFATQRLGKDVIDLEDVDLARGERQLLAARDLAARPGRPGRHRRRQRRRQDLGAVAARRRRWRPTPAGSSTAGPSRCSTSPSTLDELDPEARVLPTVESIRRVTRTADGEESRRRSMLERFGFTGDRLTARLGDLSGGERRRFQLLRLLLTEPNVLLLDEPTNDLDIETLNVLEDFLDGWPGTLVVVSHDRYFLERVTDSIWALLGDGQIVDAAARGRRVPRAPGGCATSMPPPAAAASVRARAPSRGLAEAQGRQRRGARRPQDHRPDRQAARADRRAGGRAERRDAEHAHDYERLAELGAAARTSSRPRGTALEARVARGGRAARVARRRLRRTARAACAAGGQPASGRAAGRSASSSALGGEQRLEGAVDGGLALGGEPHEHAAPVVAGRGALDEPARGEPVDPVGHGAAGHQRLAQQPARGELVRRARRGAAPPARRTPTTRCRARRTPRGGPGRGGGPAG